MALFGSHLDRPLYDRGPSPGLRFTIYAIVSIVLMYYDRHGQLVQRIRYALDAATYPVQVAVGSPRVAWRWLSQSLQTRDALQLQNRQLQDQLRELELKTMRQAALEQENAQLRGLRASLPPLISHWQLAQIIAVETDPLRQRIVIDKGAHDGVLANQAVVDGNGILGQVARVGPWSAEVILVTDPEHAIPVQVTRNSLRSVALGGGSGGELLLPYLASNADVKPGDLLVSSGLGGVFPAGFPVARIVGVRPDGSQQSSQVRARPLADVTRDREVILLQFDPANPAAPAPNPPIAPAPPPKPAPATKAPVPDDE
ncbi:MAG TPA: rod shape-determining protein MreC [Steroidobacteraceae bacterium]|jgi:rod shape-determining protein MreC|nr:rod shape-determining protein MreC [Steroidobacteraceae bacterium]